MSFYEVFPASASYHGSTALTYSSPDKLEVGQVVEVSVRKSVSLAVITKIVKKPDFKTTEINKIINGYRLSDKQLNLFFWMMEFYPSPAGTTARLFVPSFLAKYSHELKPVKQEIASKDTPPKLTKDQVQAYKKIVSLNKAESCILNAITGSGKTRIYIELAKDATEAGKSVLILTPEIALTAPLAIEFKKYFSGKVEINHSHQTPKQKLDMFQRIKTAEKPIIVIGPRSALFMPFNKLGLIVVDEFHESAYKQESAPFYHANRVASKLAELSNAKLIFGSATPSVNDYYLAEQKNKSIIEINTSAITQKAPDFNKIVIDLTKKSEQTPYSLISKKLISEIENSLSKKEQILVFINKRGSYRSVLCRDCGWLNLCKNCELPLIYHQDKHISLCHTCGYSEKTPSTCPVCGSMEILFSSPGTKTIYESLTKIFPKAMIARYDKDNKKHERIENNFDDIKSGKVDILVGTQMITKGFDLPKLSLVVMLITESSLNFPDFTSNEKSYQLIKQLAGRINRGHRKGKIILQTFKPENNLINLTEKKWSDFYKLEIKNRQMLGFPPFYNALKITFSAKDRLKTEQTLVAEAEEI